MNMHTPRTYVAHVIMTGYCVHIQNNISDTCACVLRTVVCRQYRFFYQLRVGMFGRYPRLRNFASTFLFFEFII